VSVLAALVAGANFGIVTSFEFEVDKVGNIGFAQLAFDATETDTRAERLGDAFPAATLGRLRVLKRRYDPDNVFRDNFNIAPSPGYEFG
jgi:hypothetical protein